jgi:hypothetical protein
MSNRAHFILSCLKSGSDACITFLQDPVHVINKYGADALRLYLINSPVVRAESLRFEEVGHVASIACHVHSCIVSQLLQCMAAHQAAGSRPTSSCLCCAGGGICHREGCVPALVQRLPLPGSECAAVGAGYRQSIPALSGVHAVSISRVSHAPCNNRTHMKHALATVLGDDDFRK